MSDERGGEERGKWRGGKSRWRKVKRDGRGKDKRSEESGEERGEWREERGEERRGKWRERGDGEREELRKRVGVVHGSYNVCENNVRAWHTVVKKGGRCAFFTDKTKFSTEID